VVVDVAKLSAGREDYLREIAHDHEEYLSGHGESPGRWYGAGAATLGQSGEASTEAFQRIFQGRHPDTGELLGRAHGKRAVPAFDLVFRPTATPRQANPRRFTQSFGCAAPAPSLRGQHARDGEQSPSGADAPAWACCRSAQ
jgi:hypothetical protein